VTARAADSPARVAAPGEPPGRPEADRVARRTQAAGWTGRGQAAG